MFSKINEKGFTLVELLVVVVIIAVLAAIAVPIFLNQRAKAQDSADQASVSALAGALNTGISTGGTAAQNPAGTLVVVDGTGAQVTVPYAGGIVTVDADGYDWDNTPAQYGDLYTMGDLTSTPVPLSGHTDFCVSVGNWKMWATVNGGTGVTKPSPGTC